MQAAEVVVLANGCFDILHYGHWLHLRAARAMGTRLIVSVTNDAFVNKGPSRPTFPVAERAAIVRELRCVDEVICVDELMQALLQVRPHIMVKGADYANNIQSAHEQFCRANNIQIRITESAIYSTRKIIRDRARQG